MQAQDQFLAYLKTSQPNLVCSRFTDWSSTAKLHCKVCGRCWKATPAIMVQRRSGCGTCAKRAVRAEQRVHIEKEYKIFCSTKNLRLLEPYTTALSKVDHRCLVCEHRFSIRPNDVRSRKEGINGCPECKRDKLRKAHTVPAKDHIRAIEAHKRVKVLNVDPVARRYLVRCLKCDAEYLGRCQDLKHGSGCVDCYHRDASRKFQAKRFRLGERTVSVLGYEPHALAHLLKKGVDPKDIRVTRDLDTPVISLPGSRKHYPDIFIPKRNLIIEVKSLWTLGITRDRLALFNRNKLKVSSALSSGFSYRMWVFNDNGNRIRLPENWHTLSQKRVRKALGLV